MVFVPNLYMNRTMDFMETVHINMIWMKKSYMNRLNGFHGTVKCTEPSESLFEPFGPWNPWNTSNKNFAHKKKYMNRLNGFHSRLCIFLLSLY